MLNSIGLFNQILKGKMVLKERTNQEGLWLTPAVKAWVSISDDLLEFLVLFI